MRLILGIIGLIFLAALFEYIVGRILLPEMGLTAPDYWTWFWTSFMIALGYVACSFLMEWMGKE